MTAFFTALRSLLPLWVGGMSLMAFCMMGFDKRRARTGGWRVRERSFFLVSLLGGTPGAVLGMLAFRHKTRRWYFRFGLPLLLLLQIMVTIFSFYFLQM